jgi:hypothetical protein
MEINLNNPIFVYYVDVTHMSHQFRDEYCTNLKGNLDRYSGITWMLVPTNFTKIECIWTSNYQKPFIDKINNFLDSEYDPSRIKQDLRELLINLINEEEKF